MTRSARRRVNRNARVIARMITRWPIDGKLTFVTAQELAGRSHHLGSARLNEIRPEVNWQLVAERANRTIDAEFKAKLQRVDSRLEALRSYIPASVCFWCSAEYLRSVRERNHNQQVSFVPASHSEREAWRERVTQEAWL